MSLKNYNFEKLNKYKITGGYFSEILPIISRISKKSIELNKKNIINKKDKDYIDNKMTDLILLNMDLLKLQENLVSMELIYSRNKTKSTLDNIIKLRKEFDQKQKQLGGYFIKINNINNFINKLNI